MATLPSPYSLVLLSFIFFYVPCIVVSGGQPQHRHLISVKSLLPSSKCYSLSSSDAVSSENSMKVVHRHGPCSPIAQQKQRNDGRVPRQDRHRAQSLHRRVAGSRSKIGGSLAGVTVPGRSGLALGNLEYIVTVGFGTPKRDMSLIFDTGSDLTWIQCLPCIEHCYPQKEPLFDPYKSSTYAQLSCDSDYCSEPITTCLPPCVYDVAYADKSESFGIMSQDTLTLTPSAVLPNFVFGCGEQDTNTFGEVAGLMGLGRDKVSIVSQSSQAYGGAFSYCLPPFASSTGYLTLGPGKQHPPNNNTQFTSLLQNPDAPSFYFVELIGLSVGGKDLQIPAGSFDNGTIIDSGTVLTYLPPDVYSALRSEFRRQMSKYPPSVPPADDLDTCYNLTGYNRVSVPEVALLFGGGVTLNVDASGILYVADISYACLAFAAISDAPSIFGNMQQKTYNVVYDVPNGKIGFGAGGCA